MGVGAEDFFYVMDSFFPGTWSVGVEDSSFYMYVVFCLQIDVRVFFKGETWEK